MKEQKFLLIICFSVIAFALSSCAEEFAQKETPFLIQAESAITPTPTPAADLDSPIRKVNFRNFSYPEIEDYPKFKLKSGEKIFQPMKR